ncbi:Prolyl Endopeptidase [Manis pentadactyla]|nr:Prolyl Endopeptidase [Manis pentadactyla]
MKLVPKLTTFGEPVLWYNKGNKFYFPIYHKEKKNRWEKNLENEILLTSMLLVLTTLSKKNPIIYIFIPSISVRHCTSLCIYCLIFHYQGIATFQYDFPKQYVKESSIITNLHQKFFLYMIVSVMYILYV